VAPLFRLDAFDADCVEIDKLADVVAHFPRLDIVCPGFL
jgi:hypothetical protein